MIQKQPIAPCATMTKNSTYSKTEPQSIQSLFNTIAPRYDLANRVLSFNLHKGWNRALINTIDPSASILLDLCGGTGEIAYTWLKKQKIPKKVLILDFSAEMLTQAKQRAPNDHEVDWLEADAQVIPLPNNSVDAITCAYGIRNIKDRSKALKEAYRVLKPGGTIGILDLTEPRSALLRPLHAFYLNQILPTIGGLITMNPKAYRYLSNSIAQFVDPKIIEDEMLEAGFKKIKINSKSGGIAHLWIARKEN